MSFRKIVSVYRRTLVINFLSIVLVIFSVIFLWWLNFNILFIPSIFLYLDFYSPLFYVVLIILLSYFVFKLLFKELVYKFLVDYLAKNVIYKVKNFKFIDNNLNKFGYIGFNFLGGFSTYFIGYINSFKYNNLIILVFLLFIFLWDFNLS